MSKGLKALQELEKELSNYYGTDIAYYPDILEKFNNIAKELKDYQEIKEIAKRYNWDDITNEIFNVKTDKKYRDLFNSAIVNIQEDYRKARALEIIKDRLIVEDKGGYIQVVCEFSIPSKNKKYDLLKETLL